MGQKTTPKDLNSFATLIVENVTGILRGNETHKKDPAAVSLGRKGGKKGGPARAAKLTPEQRSEIARKAAQARYGKK